MARSKAYRVVKRIRPDLYRQVGEVGLCVTCAPPEADRLTMAAAAECRAMEIVAGLLLETGDE